MKKHTATIATLAIAAFGLISIAAAQGPGGPQMRRPGGEGFGPGRGPGHRAEMIADHLGLSDEQKVSAGAGPDVVRLSVGIEDVEDIIADLDQAMNAGA